MPLLDHFRSPLADEAPWEGFHSTWATTIAAQLNAGVLPPDYRAIPHVKAGSAVEIDVATSYQPPGAGSINPEPAPGGWAPPQPSLTLEVDFVGPNLFEVQIVRRLGGPQLRAAIELVSPTNKDRSTHRHAFAVKCASYLQNGVSVVVVDVVTERSGNMHAEILDVLQLRTGPAWQSPTELYALAYRTVPQNGKSFLQIWPETIHLRAVLPTMLLWIEPDQSVSLVLEDSYRAACVALRIAV